MYGPQPLTSALSTTSAWFISQVFFKDRKLVAQLLDGWNFAPLFTAQSGAPLEVNISGGGTTIASRSANRIAAPTALTKTPCSLRLTRAATRLHENVTSSTSVASSGNPAKGGSGLNIFADPNAVYGQFRRLILGVDTTGGGAGVLRNFPTWNLDMAISKDFKISVARRHGHHIQRPVQQHAESLPARYPALNIDSPTTFGVVTTQANTPRQIEFGLRLHW